MTLADDSQLEERERNAMRAYLARAEVRMSTMHRIATTYISGAGLLLLIPIFLRDVFDGILHFFLTTFGQSLFEPTAGGLLLTLILYITLLYPFFLSLMIPLYALYLLLKDIVHFYFSIYTPGITGDLLNPSFSPIGLMLSPDEAPQAKREVMRLQYQPQNSRFTLPFSEGRRELYFDRVIKNTNGEIIPQSRRNLEGILSDDVNMSHVHQLNAAFGITRSLDRSLIEEVAITEMTLTRNILYLRRLVLRYIKALLMFVWTTLISFAALPFLQDGQFPPLLVLSILYFIWAVAVMRIMHLPIQWMYRHRYGDTQSNHIDVQLIQMENQVRGFCHLAIVMAFISMLLSLLALGS